MEKTVTQIEGKKVDMTQKFTPKGVRKVVTRIKTEAKVELAELFKAGDKVKVTGWAKGKGFAGVVKRWGFKGGPKTHGQSDRMRAPGSIGQGTTPGRVYKGKKMAGRMGGQRVTVSGLKIFGLDQENHFLLVTGLVPGSRNGKLIVKKMKEGKVNAEG